jgi:uncharacterized protein YcbK (DUF882 family)
MTSLPLVLSRRAFLTTAVTAVPFLATPVAALANSIEQRSVSFVHTHTGEHLKATYFRGGHYDPASLARVNYLLRDFRRGEVAEMDTGLLDILYDLQVLADRDSTFEIISGFRSPATNAQLRAKSGGVAEKSLHMQGKALDIRLTGFSTKKLHEYAMSLRRGGVGFYGSSDFVHVDTGRVRYW